MYVIKRNGKKQPVFFDKITARISNVSWGLSQSIDVICVAKKVIQGVYDGVETSEIDELTAQTAASMITRHPHYGTLAARIQVSNLHKNTEKTFSKVIESLYLNKNIDHKIYEIVKQRAEQIDSALIYDRDYCYDYFGIKTLMKSYLFRINDVIIERPQHLLMRVSLGIHFDDIQSVLETYNLMSQKYFIHASPTLFNAGTLKPQLSSCFLMTMKEDSIEGIYDTLKQCAMISKHAGGIGLSIHNIRGKGSRIRGTNGTANGLVSMLRVFNNTARYVDQGGGRRKGSFAIYLETWHCDIFSFLSLKKNHGKEEQRCRDLFFALWICDLFMERVLADKHWCLMCPDECGGLSDCYGADFNALYVSYEEQKKYVKQIRARQLWSAILHSQMETGQPFMLYKDHCNRKSNQKHLGCIKNANLCCEIVEYCSENEIAVCNLASISLPQFVDAKQQRFDFKLLRVITSVITKNLNKIIDVNYYPLPECKKSNLLHRPIGIGVQGLADVFLLLRMEFDGREAAELNKRIFETIYYSAVKTSNELAMSCGAYKTFAGSPVSAGLLQFDLWNKTHEATMYDWDGLKRNIIKYGLRNSLLTAPMPTATTSQILGNNECFEPYTSNVYLRRTLAGEYVVLNKHLFKDLIALGIYNERMKEKLIAHNGSVQLIDEIPAKLKGLYKTVWEIKQKDIINMAVDRAVFIDQSQSLNIHMDNVNYAKLTSMHFYTWKKGLKTGMYYLRTKSAVDPIKFTISPKQINKIQQIQKENKSKNGFYDKKESQNDHDNKENDDNPMCSRYNKEACLMCGS